MNVSKIVLIQGYQSIKKITKMIRSALIIAITDLILRISNKPKHKDHD